jgi:hypothetical protein
LDQIVLKNYVLPGFGIVGSLWLLSQDASGGQRGDLDAGASYGADGAKGCIATVTAPLHGQR